MTMETRSKRQEREAEEELRRNPNYRRWADLPDIALSSVSDRLLSIPDISSFSSVCRSFTSIARSSVPATPRPPLLLRSFLPSSRRFSAWPRSPRCRFQSPVPSDTARSFPSRLHPKTLTSTCLGSSYGHLIVDVGTTCVVADIITGKEINVCLDRFAYHVAAAAITAVLTAPPSAPVCWLVTSSPKSTMFWKLGTYEYVMVGDLRYSTEVVSLAVMGDKVISLGKHFRLFVIDLTPKIAWKRLAVQPPQPRLRSTCCYDGVFSPRLIECGGDLLLLIIERKLTDLMLCTFRVYKLDTEAMRWEVKEGGVGDWCFFIDPMGQRSVACRNPESWGGRSNSVYVTGPVVDTWRVFPLDGSEVNVVGSPLGDALVSVNSWPSPVWFYPSMFYKE